MNLPKDMVPAIFLKRLNRFAALVELGGREVQAHVANSGRLVELFQPGREVLLAPRPGALRRTGYDLVLVRIPSGWVSADARFPPLLVREALALGRIPEFQGYVLSRAEVPWGESRLDLALSRGPESCLVEVKSVTLVESGRSLFPDAPTLRGARHLQTLVAARRQGLAAAVIFVVQREDALPFSPHDEADPAFGAALRLARDEDVGVYAYRCVVQPDCIELSSPVPVLL